MRRHELVRGVVVGVLPPAFRQHIFLLRLQHGEPSDFIQITSEPTLARDHRQRSTHIFHLHWGPRVRRALARPLIESTARPRIYNALNHAAPHYIFATLSA